jgi:hypothetical protein
MRPCWRGGHADARGGDALIIPMAITWIRTHEWYGLDLEWDQLLLQAAALAPVWHALLAFTPLIVYLIWKFSYYGAISITSRPISLGGPPLDIGKGFNPGQPRFMHDMLAGILPFGRPGLAGQFYCARPISANYLDRVCLHGWSVSSPSCAA